MCVLVLNWYFCMETAMTSRPKRGSGKESVSSDTRVNLWGGGCILEVGAVVLSMRAHMSKDIHLNVV